MTHIFVTFYLNTFPELVCVTAKTKKERAEKMTKNGIKKDSQFIAKKKIFKVYLLSS